MRCRELNAVEYSVGVGCPVDSRGGYEKQSLETQKGDRVRLRMAEEALECWRDIEVKVGYDSACRCETDRAMRDNDVLSSLSDPRRGRRRAERVVGCVG